jgi:hypothetical protein
VCKSRPKKIIFDQLVQELDEILEAKHQRIHPEQSWQRSNPATIAKSFLTLIGIR